MSQAKWGMESAGQTQQDVSFSTWQVVWPTGRKRVSYAKNMSRRGAARQGTP